MPLHPREIGGMSDAELRDLARQPVGYDGRQDWQGRTISGYDSHNAGCELGRRHPPEPEPGDGPDLSL